MPSAQQCRETPIAARCFNPRVPGAHLQSVSSKDRLKPVRLIAGGYSIVLVIAGLKCATRWRASRCDPGFLASPGRTKLRLHYRSAATWGCLFTSLKGFGKAPEILLARNAGHSSTLRIALRASSFASRCSRSGYIACQDALRKVPCRRAAIPGSAGPRKCLVFEESFGHSQVHCGASAHGQ